MAKKSVEEKNMKTTDTSANLVTEAAEESKLIRAEGALTNEQISQLLDGEEFVKIGTQKRVYRAECCKNYPLVGFVIGIEQFEGTPTTTPNGFEMAVVRTTQPTIVFSGTEDKVGNAEVEEVPAGTDVLVVVTYALEDLKKLADRRDYVHKVVIKPLHKRKFTDKQGAAKAVWEMEMAVSKKQYTRADVAPETLQLETTETAVKAFEAL